MLAFRRLLVFVFLAGILFIIVAASLPMSAQYYNSLVQPWNNILGTRGKPPSFLFVTIFTNNIRVLLLDTLPVAGPVLYFVSLYETAALLHVGVAGTPAFSAAPSASAIGLFAIPDTPLEILAYTFPATTTLYFLINQFQTRKVRPSKYSIFFSSFRDFVDYCKLLLRGFAYGLVVLFIAAVIEASVIGSVMLVFVLWVPAFLLLEFLLSTRVSKRLPDRIRKLFNLDRNFLL